MNVWWSQTMVQGVGWTLLHFLWQGLVIAALLAIGLRLLRRGPAQYRYLAGCAALLLMTLAPLVTFQLVLKQDEPAPAPVVETMVPDAPAPVERAAPRAVTLPKIVVTATPEARAAENFLAAGTIPAVAGGGVAARSGAGFRAACSRAGCKSAGSGARTPRPSRTAGRTSWRNWRGGWA